MLFSTKSSLISYAVNRDVALAIINSDSWQDAMRWRAENDKHGQYTPMKLLITHMPGKLKHYYCNANNKIKGAPH